MQRQSAASWRRTFQAHGACARCRAAKMPLSPAANRSARRLNGCPCRRSVAHPAGSPATQAQALFAGIWREEFGCLTSYRRQLLRSRRDSMTALGIVVRARSAGFRLRPSDVFDHRRSPSGGHGAATAPAAASAALNRRTPAHGGPDARAAPGDPAGGPPTRRCVPASPTQYSIYLHSLLCADNRPTWTSTVTVCAELRSGGVSGRAGRASWRDIQRYAARVARPSRPP